MMQPATTKLDSVTPVTNVPGSPSPVTNVPGSPSARATRVRYMVLGILCTAAVLAYIHRGFLGVPRESIRRDLEISAAQMDWALSAFFLGYTLFQIPAGWLADAWGTRRSLTIFIFAWSTATGLISLVGGFTSLFSLQVINGMAQAGIFSCCVKSFSHWFPLRERAFPSGLLGSFMSVGAALAAFLTGWLLNFYTWQATAAILALPGVLFAGLFFGWFRDRPEDHSWVNDAERRHIEGQDAATAVPQQPAKLEPFPWTQVLSSLSLLALFNQQLFRAAAYVFLPTMFPTYLRETLGVNESMSGYLTSLPLLGVVVGCAAGGVAIDRVLRRTGSRSLSRKGMAVFGMGGAGLCFVFAYLASEPAVVIFWAVASSFLAAMGGPASYTASIDLGGRYVATLFSIMNTAGNFGAFLLPITLGWFVRQTSWDMALLFVAGLYAVATACWFFVNVEAQAVGTDASTR